MRVNTEDKVICMSSHSVGLLFGDNAQPEGQERSETQRVTLQVLGELVWL